MIKYRIKTESEFINEFGEDWRNERRGDFSCFVGSMDFLFGQEIDITKYDIFKYENGYTELYIEKGFSSKIDLFDTRLYINHESGWCLTMDELVESQKTPTYNEKKILVYE